MTTSAPSRWIDYLPLDDIPRAHRNPKNHDLAKIRGSVEKFGLTVGGILDERTGRLVAGHGRLEILTAMRDEGATPPEGVMADGHDRWMVPIWRGWSSRSDAEAEAYIVSDNHLSEIGGWHSPSLADVLGDLHEHDPDLLELTGYTTEDLADLLASFDDPAHGDDEHEMDELDAEEEAAAEDGATRDPERSELLALAGVTVGEPRHQVQPGQVWRLGEHHLVVADLFTGWAAWSGLLQDDDVFLPYPTALAPWSRKLKERRLVMVQPEPYLAGHLLDKWENITGQAPHLDTGELAA